MYVKPPRRQLHTGFVPDNYNGTAFSESQDRDEQEVLEPQPPAPELAKEPLTLPASAISEKAEEKGLLSSLFSGFGDLRSDDLLLLALILLMSRGGDEGKHTSNEILPLLALLLFMG